MTVTIFRNRQINIPEATAKAYEGAVRPLTPELVQYLAITGDCDDSSSDEEITSAVVDGLNEEIYIYTHRDEIAYQAAEAGVFND